MAFAFLPFPYLNSYTLTTQFVILLVLLALSYSYRTFRVALLAFLGTYAAYKITVPVVRWGYTAFKAIAMFGFYVNFFIVGVGYIFTGAAALWHSPELLRTFLDSLEGK
ncbi:hypothetical protein DFH07DRAFT_930553 [Mycena maculata]|uniref:Uncharacterized protein n=1 Tax=Mycena maculata TaxID=230809 RepID=A0AAD7MS33_9AGAR|nr:hypothetical protein DFH07DRAFT_930553 [Mycena maculata]